MPAVQLEQGTIHYEEAGPPDGRPVVFVHGYLMAGDLWAGLAERLAGRGLRAIMPTLAARRRIPSRCVPAPTSPRAAIAAIVAAFLEALRLDGVGARRQRHRRRDLPARRRRPSRAPRRARADQLRRVRATSRRASSRRSSRRRKLPGGAEGGARADAHRGGAALAARLRDALPRRRRPPRASAGSSRRSPSRGVLDDLRRLDGRARQAAHARRRRPAARLRAARPAGVGARRRAVPARARAPAGRPPAGRARRDDRGLEGRSRCSTSRSGSPP